MPTFAYIARDMKGNKVTGTLEAGAEREVINQLSSKSLFPISVTAEAKKSGGLQLFGRGVSGQALATVYSQLSALLRSGVALLRAIAVLRDQSSNARLTEVLTEVYDDVEQGDSLGDAMARHDGVFSEMAINMVKAGGEGGFLEDALERVATFTEEQEDLKSRTIGALAYPVLLSTVGFIIVSVLIVFFVPMFGVMFERLRERGELPILTDWLLGFSDTIRAYWWAIAAVVLGVFFFLRYYLATPEGRFNADRVRIGAPLIGIIFQNLAVARFCRVLGTLLHNGVPILKSLEISREAAGNKVLSKAIEEASENISSGESLATPLMASGRFPRTVVEMISVGEESNTLDTVLVDIAEGLEKRTSRRLDLLVRLLEPAMLLILAGVVLMVVIALLLPIIKMSGNFG